MLFTSNTSTCPALNPSLSPPLFVHQALEAGKTAQCKRVYYDFADYLRTNPTGNVPYTPSLPLLYGTK